MADSHSDHIIICPMCDYKTEVKATDLPKLRVSDFKSMVNAYLEAKDEEFAKFCNYCELSTQASKSCYECKLCFCACCSQQHKQVEALFHHKITRISGEQFCRRHPEMFVLGICTDCDVRFCPACLRDHTTHTCTDMKRLAVKARKTLQTKAVHECTLRGDMEIANAVNRSIQHLKLVQSKLPNKVGILRKQLQALDKKLESMEGKTTGKLSNEITELEKMKGELEDFIQSKKDLYSYLLDVLEDGSDPELVSCANAWPKFTSTTCLDVMEKTKTFEPKLSGFDTTAKLLSQIDQFIQAQFATKSLTKPPQRPTAQPCEGNKPNMGGPIITEGKPPNKIKNKLT